MTENDYAIEESSVFRGLCRVISPLGVRSLLYLRPFCEELVGLARTGQLSGSLDLHNFEEDTLDQIALKEGVCQGFLRAGWQRGGLVAVSHRSYATAVGPKVANVYLALWGAAETNATLCGEYWSCGNNVLATEWVSVPKSAAPAQISAAVETFVARADAAVAESYAARLLLRWGT